MISTYEKRMVEALNNHWPEYLIEAWCLATFMVSACFFGVAFFHPGSPLAGVDHTVRLAAMGIAMGSTAIVIISSPWGRRSGAHFNPAVTLTFFRLGKVAPPDAMFYMLSHFVGGVSGVLISWAILGSLLADSAVNFVTTVPGRFGAGAAFMAETVISFVMMLMILFTSNSPGWSRMTPYFAGSLVAFYIATVSAISGMSMNPARTFASAAVGWTWTAWWIYFTAPPLAMLAAAEVFIRLRGPRAVRCAKLDHHNTRQCIFDCRVDRRGNGTLEVTKNMHLFPSIKGLL